MLEKLAIKEDTIVVLKNFDELRNDMSVASGYNADEIEIFVSGSTVPLIQEFSQVTTHDYLLLAFTLLIAFYHHLPDHTTCSQFSDAHYVTIVVQSMCHVRLILYYAYIMILILHNSMHLS